MVRWEPFTKQTTGEKTLDVGCIHIPSKRDPASPEIHSPEYRVTIRGEVRERPNRRDWKSRVPAMVPWVRTPPSPPFLVCRGGADFLSRFPLRAMTRWSIETVFRGWALCDRILRTPPGPEGSNGKWASLCAAGSPGPD
jgi:hypothetical protein